MGGEPLYFPLTTQTQSHSEDYAEAQGRRRERGRISKRLRYGTGRKNSSGTVVGGWKGCRTGMSLVESWVGLGVVSKNCCALLSCACAVTDWEKGTLFLRSRAGRASSVGDPIIAPILLVHVSLHTEVRYQRTDFVSHLTSS